MVKITLLVYLVGKHRHSNFTQKNIYAQNADFKCFDYNFEISV